MATNQAVACRPSPAARSVLDSAADLTDSALLGLFVERRDEAAFEALLQRHGGMILGACRRMLVNPHDAEDAFQATFLVLVRKADSIRPRERVAGWLYGVACQTALKSRANAAKRAQRERQVAELPEPVAARSEAWNELRPVLDEELSRLPDKYRIPIVLCDLEGLDHAEAARQLGWPVGTVSGRLSRGRGLLAGRLKRLGLVFSAGSLAVVLSERAASAWAPPSLIGSTVKSARLFTAGAGASPGAIPVPAAALAEGVLQAMAIAKFKFVAAALLGVATAGLGAGTAAQWAVAGAGEQPRQPVAAEAPQERTAARPAVELAAADQAVTERAAAGRAGGERKPVERTPEPPPAFSGAKVAAVSADGRTLTFEVPAKERGAPSTRTDVRIADATDVRYRNIGTNMARPAEGYLSTVWLQEGSSDTAARVVFDGPIAPPSLTATVVSVGTDGKSFTVETPIGRDPNAEKRKTEVTFTEQTPITYFLVAPGGNKPTVGYQAEMWFDKNVRGSTQATKLIFTDTSRRADGILSGKVVAVGNGGGSVTLEVASRNRGEGPVRTEVKLTPTTETIYNNVGPDGAKLTEGYGAQVWLQEGTTDTANKIVLGRIEGRR